MVIPSAPWSKDRLECILRVLAKLPHPRGNGHRRDASHGCAFRYISSHDCIGAYGCFVANTDSAENSYRSSQPDLLAEFDGFGSRTGVANGPVGITGMICIADAGVFAN